MKVSAEDLGTGKSKKLQLHHQGLSDEEINQMVKDAEAHAADDEKLRKIDLVNQADSTIFQTEKFINENEEKISSEQKQQIEEAIEPVKKALEADDHEGIKSSLDILNEKMQSAATEMYANAQNSSDGNNQDNQNDNKSNPDIEEAVLKLLMMIKIKRLKSI